MSLCRYSVTVRMLLVSCACINWAQATQGTGTLTGIVLLEHSGRGVPAAHVRLLNLSHAAYTAADGSFAFRSLPAGDYSLQVESALIRRLRAVTCRVESGRETYVKLVIDDEGEVQASFTYSDLPRGRISGRVYSASGAQPVAGAQVRLSGSTEAYVTGPDGYYQFDNIGAGIYSLSALVEECAVTMLEKVELGAGAEVTQDIVIGLPKRTFRRGGDDEEKGIIIGVVTQNDRVPLAAVRVELGDKATATFSDKHGFFRLPDVPAACHALTLSGGDIGKVTIAGVPVVPRHITQIDIRVSEPNRARVDTRIVPWSGATVRLVVLDERNEPVSNALLSLDNDSVIATSDSTGVMVAADLPGGQYTGRVLTDNYEDVVLRSLMLYEGMVSEDTIRVSRPVSSGTVLAQIRGKVFEESTQRPVVGVQVILDSGGVRVVSDSLGEFVLPGLSVGVHSLRFVLQGRVEKTVGPIVLAGDTTVYLSVGLSADVLEDVTPEQGDPVLRIRGRIVDVRGGGIGGAAVTVDKTQIRTVAGRDGTFQIGPIRTGRYTVTCSALGFKPTIVPVESSGRDTTVEMTVVLQPDDIRDLGRETVMAAVVTNTSAGMLLERRQTLNFTDAISAQEFSRAGATSVAEAMRQVPGVTLLDGKYVAIRGLSDRYINTTLNGMLLPSPDPDKRAVPLDMFPTGLLDNVVTNKSFTPDKPADFAGGNVDIRTTAIPDKFTVGVSLSGSLDSAVFCDSCFLTYSGGKTDWLGIDDGTRALPEIVDKTKRVPTQTIARNDSEQAHLLDELTKAFQSGFVPDRTNKTPDMGLGIMVADRVDLWRTPLGWLLSFTYSHKSSAYTDVINNRYEYQQVAELGTYNELGYLRAFREDKSQRDILWGGLAGLTVEPAKEQSVGFHYLYVHNAEDEVKHAKGFIPNLEAGRIAEYYSIQYSERNLSTWQLRGRHRLPLRVSLDWHVSGATTHQGQPDQRIMMFHHLEVPDEEVGYDYSTHENILPVKHPERIFRNLDEKSFESGADITLRPLGYDDTRFVAQIGLMLFERERRYRVRRFTFEPDRSGAVTLNDAGGPEGYFDTTNLGIVRTRVRGEDTTFIFGLYLNELNVESVNYDATRKIPALYVMLTGDALRWLNITGGVRVEEARLRMSNQADTKVNQVYLSWLPSLGLKLTLAKEMLLRLSYGKTLARPTERELEPPPGSFDPSENVAFMGNPSLTQTTIHNTDLRWEWYPDPSDLFSVSLFHKHLLAPIERTVVDNNGTISYRNVPDATIMGAEFEVRYSLGHLHRVLEPFSAGGNVAFISSRLTIDSSEYRLRKEFDPTAKPTRQLQGQAPWVVNAYLTFAPAKLGLNLATTFNIVGPTIATVSAGSSPDIYTTPRPNLGISLSKSIGKRFSVETSVRNLFGDSRKAISTFGGKEYVNVEQGRGRTYGLKLSYKFR